MSDLKQIRQKYSLSIPAIDFDLLAAAALKKNKEFVLAHPEYRPTICRRLRLAYFLFKRKRGWPMAYILGHKEFCGLDFLVNRHVLIPRPETELMVEEAARQISNFKFLISKQIPNPNNQILLIDVGTGSGCVPIAIMKTLKHENPDVKSGSRPCVGTFATDISGAALRVAEKNAKRHGVKINFLRGDLLEPVLKKVSSFQFPVSSVIITANLPYLTQNQFAGEPSIQKEPRLALIADNADGLSLYEKLFKQITGLLETGNWKLEILAEVDPRQSAAALTLAKKYFPNLPTGQAGAIIEIKKDLAGRDRLVLINTETRKHCNTKTQKCSSA